MTDLYTLTPSQIVMYSTQTCYDWVRVKALFEANKIPHLRVSLEGDAQATIFLLKINNGFQIVPTITFADGSILVEPNWAELKAKVPNSR